MKKILIIEDDKIMRENTCEILELANFEVVSAPNGMIGVELAHKIKPDLIICDIMMPVLDGYGVIHELSSNPTTATIPFIFLTAITENKDVRKGMALGADDYLTKPYDETELLKVIEIRLKKASICRAEFSRDIHGLDHFINEVGGLEELQGLSRNGQIVKLRKKELLFQIGESPEYLFFLNKGSVKTFIGHDDGKELITNIYKPGDFFGHVALFENKQYTDTASIQEESEICKIPKSDFLSLVNKNRDVSQKFIKILSNQIEEQEKVLLRMAYDSVRKRTAAALLDLGQKQGSQSNPHTLKISRDDLASLVATASETVIRCLGDFKDHKLISIQGKEITLLSIQGLEAIH